MANKPAEVSDRYPWVALTNTTASMFMATLDGSIVIIALPAIFRGIGLDPLAPGSIFYLLWMIMGYRLVQAVMVVGLGRLVRHALSSYRVPRGGARRVRCSRPGARSAARRPSAGSFPRA